MRQNARVGDVATDGRPAVVSGLLFRLSGQWNDSKTGGEHHAAHRGRRRSLCANAVQEFVAAHE
jgi:hypothetical protein